VRKARERAGVPAEGAEVPDLLTFRERHCAYIDEANARVVRAENNWFQKDAYEQLQKHNRLIMVLPPGHIKTTFFGMELATHDIMSDRNARLLNIQKNEEEAAKVVAAVQQRLTDHEYYENLANRLVAHGERTITDPIAAYGGKAGFKPTTYRALEKWGTYGFHVSGRTSGEKDYTMQAKGVGSQIQGIRAKRIVLDDIQDPQRISPTDTATKAEWFQRVILGRVYAHQQLVILGNLFAPSDWMNWLIETYGEMWPVVRYPAVLNFDEQKVLCPEVWTFDGLMTKKKEVGEAVWHYTWMQAEGTFDDDVFKKESMDAAKHLDYTVGQVPSQVTHVAIGCDPAISQFCAIVAWGLDSRTGQRYLIDVFNEKGLRTFSNIQRKIVSYVQAYGPKVVAIEMNNVQGSISNDPEFVKEVRSYGASVVTYQTRTQMGARAETDDFDISSVGALFDEGLVVLPYGDEHSRKIVDAYVSQLLDWRPGVKYLTRDMVMATLFAESQARELYLKAKHTSTGTYVSKAPKWVARRWKERQRASA